LFYFTLKTFPFYAVVILVVAAGVVFGGGGVAAVGHNFILLKFQGLITI
jgi:hypothetical protein